MAIVLASLCRWAQARSIAPRARQMTRGRFAGSAPSGGARPAPETLTPVPAKAARPRQREARLFLAARFFEPFLDVFLDDFLRAGTFAPSLRASDSPMAMACLRLVTFLPERPERSLPLFISSMLRCTFLPAFLLERRELFLPELFLPELFLPELFFRVAMTSAQQRACHARVRLWRVTPASRDSNQ